MLHIVIIITSFLKKRKKDQLTWVVKSLESKQHLKRSYVAIEKEMCLSILFTENTTSLWAMFTPPIFSIDIQDGHLPFLSPWG